MQYMQLFMLLFFPDTIRAVSASKIALLVPKGINFFPSNNDKASGTIDVWWIVRILLYVFCICT